MNEKKLNWEIAKALWEADRSNAPQMQVPFIPQLALSMEMNSIHYGYLADQILAKASAYYEKKIADQARTVLKLIADARADERAKTLELIGEDVIEPIINLYVNKEDIERAWGVWRRVKEAGTMPEVKQ